MTTILPSVLSALVTLVVCLINNHYQQKEVEKKHSETIALISYRLDELSDRVDKHNNLVERMYEVEGKTAVQEERIKVVNHRIEDLEKGANQ